MSSKNPSRVRHERLAVIRGRENYSPDEDFFLQKSNWKENELLIKPNVDLADGPELLDGHRELREKERIDAF